MNNCIIKKKGAREEGTVVYVVMSTKFLANLKRESLKKKKKKNAKKRLLFIIDNMTSEYPLCPTHIIILFFYICGCCWHKIAGKYALAQPKQFNCTHKNWEMDKKGFFLHKKKKEKEKLKKVKKGDKMIRSHLTTKKEAGAILPRIKFTIFM